jgi:hypothetical protein
VRILAPEGILRATIAAQLQRGSGLTEALRAKCGENPESSG